MLVPLFPTLRFWYLKTAATPHWLLQHLVHFPLPTWFLRYENEGKTYLYYGSNPRRLPRPLEGWLGERCSSPIS